MTFSYLLLDPYRNDDYVLNISVCCS